MEIFYNYDFVIISAIQLNAISTTRILPLNERSFIPISIEINVLINLAGS